MDQLYQAEWCPHSSRVRQRFTELGVSFIARPVPAERVDREEMRRKTGTDEIPARLLEDGTAVTGVEAIIAHLDAQFGERADSVAHRERATEASLPSASGPGQRP
jgi:glutathione S-transferase